MEKPQSPDIQAQLNQARENLQRLGNAVSELVNLSPDVFNDEAIKTRLQDFQQAYEEASQRLANPSFRIATIGTTSSGKSTIVNALMGRRIAPMEAGEMSGGVLTLKHSVDRKLVIEATENAVWETGEWTDINDRELYDRIQIAMHSYHEARKKKEYIAPQITAHIPLLPACDANLSGLPEGINVEFLDLPGLKSVQDKTNLAILQPLVGKAFSLVALDYMQVDEQHRQKLLTELKKVVEYLQGRTDSMIFILNRVDQRGSDDKPLDERLQQLKTEIQEQLNLPSLPDIIPFNARLLYYAQCAWGTNPLHTNSNVTPEVRSKLLKSLFKDCANIIEYKTENDWDLEDWFTEIKKSVKRDGFIDDEQMRQLLNYALKWSGGEQLWGCIRKRIEESFFELVIVPILLDIFKSYDSFASSVNLFIQTRKIGNLEDVTQKQEQLMKFRKEFPSLAKKIKYDFDTELDEYREAIKNRGATEDSRIAQKALKNERQGFEIIFSAINDIKKGLVEDIILLVRDAFKHNEGAYDLKDKLQEVIAPSLAENIAREYDHVSRRITVDFISKDSYLLKKARIDDTKKIQELEHDEKYVRLLYHTVKDALTIRAEFSLQAKEKDFTQALNGVVNDQLERFRLCIPEDILGSLGVEKAVISDIEKKLNENLTTLPDNLFDFNADIKENKLSQREKIGTKKETKTKNVGSCLNKRTESYTVTIDQFGDIKYKELLIPNPNKMAEQWIEGIENRESDLLDILFDWIADKLDNCRYLFSESVNNILNLTERFLDEQSHKLWEQKLDLEKLAILESCYHNANNIRQKLAQEYHLIDEEVINDKII